MVPGNFTNKFLLFDTRKKLKKNKNQVREIRQKEEKRNDRVRNRKPNLYLFPLFIWKTIMSVKDEIEEWDQKSNYRHNILKIEKKIN